MGPSWYVLLTEPRAEYLAAAELSRGGFEIFFPRVKAAHKRAGRADEPLFPGYLFLHHDIESGGWPSFRIAHHVVGWVSFGGVIPSIPDQAITDLARRMEALNTSHGLWQRFRPGDRVRVVSGNLEGLAEVVEEAKSPQARTKVLLEFMGRLVQAQIPWQNLRSLDDSYRDRHRPPRRTRGQGRWIRGFGTRELAKA